MKSVVLFDLDETLVAQERAFSVSFEAAERLSGVSSREIALLAQEVLAKYSCAEVIRRCRFGGRDVLWAEPGDGTSCEREIAEFVRRYRREVWRSVTDDAALAERMGEVFGSSMRESMELLPDAKPAIERLADRARLAVVTNGMQRAQQVKLERLGLAPYFERLVASTDVGRGKPAAEIFGYALDAMNVKAADAVMVGDSLDGDVDGAIQAGIDAIWVNRGDGSANRPDGVEIRDLGDLEAVL